MDQIGKRGGDAARSDRKRSGVAPIADAPREIPGKAKIARRVVEVLDYFDDDHREATVMDIARRYKRPQSSTSELLSSLVELGLLVKKPNSRSYSLTPRAGLLGTGGQGPLVREGHLGRMVDRLSAQTGLSIALFGMVGLNTQIFAWRPGARCARNVVQGLYGGRQEPLCGSTAGWLLLSTIAPERRGGFLRRLNAEADEERKFSVPEVAGLIEGLDGANAVTGVAGFGSRAQLIARLLPTPVSEQPLVVGVLYGDKDRVDSEVLKRTLQDAMRQLENAIDGQFGIRNLSTAA